MNKDLAKKNNNLKVRIPMYFVGLFLMTIGIAISVKSNLGVSPVSSIPYTMTCVWGIEMGKATILFHTILVHVPDVAGQQGFQLGFDQRKCRAELGLVVGDAHGGALCHQLIEHGLAHLEFAVEAVERLVLLEPFFPVAVNQLDVQLHHGAFVAQ